MRTNPEFSYGEPLLSPEEDSEPLPITLDLIQELLDHIKDLWREHNKAIYEQNYDMQEKVETALHFAYHQLDTIKDLVSGLELSNELKMTLEDELWFSCFHLHKVIKYLA